MALAGAPPVGVGFGATGGLVATKVGRRVGVASGATGVGALAVIVAKMCEMMTASVALAFTVGRLVGGLTG